MRRGAERYPGGDPDEGVETLHAFSFGGHYDPANVAFGPLIACNEERLAPGAGFAEHPHRDTEIVTWVVEGELEHRDDQGRTARLGAGDVQRLSAGGGVRHCERNGGLGTLRFVQMWLRPDVVGGAPEYDAVTGPLPRGGGGGGGLTVLCSGVPDAGPAAVRLRVGGATLYAAKPQGATQYALPAAPRHYLHVVRGTVRVAGVELGPGDAGRLAGAGPLRAATRGAAEYLLWTFS